MKRFALALLPRVEGACAAASATRAGSKQAPLELLAGEPLLEERDRGASNRTNELTGITHDIVTNKHDDTDDYESVRCRVGAVLPEDP